MTQLPNSAKAEPDRPNMFRLDKILLIISFLEGQLILSDKFSFAGKRVLIIGVDNIGAVVRHVAEWVLSEGWVIAIDRSTAALSTSQQRVEQRGYTNIELIEMDIDRPTFAANSFDAVLCPIAMTELKDVSAALNLWHHFLKPGGLVLFSCFGEDICFRILQACVQRHKTSIKNPYEPLINTESCQALLQQAGFEQIEVKIRSNCYYYKLDEAETIWSEFLYNFGNLQAVNFDRFKAEGFAALEASAIEVVIDDPHFNERLHAIRAGSDQPPKPTTAPRIPIGRPCLAAFGFKSNF